MPEYNNPRGFTIVELLIVVVVIGVLAGLVLNMFGDAQRRARNAHRLSAVDASRKLIRAYDIQYGQLPPPPYGRYCLSDENLPTDGSGNKICGETGSTKKATFDQNLIDELKRIKGTLAGGEPVRTYPDNVYYGPTLEYAPGWTMNGEDAPYVLHYWLEGEAQKCSGQSIIFNVTGPAPPGGYEPATLEPSGQEYSYTDSQMTYCYEPLILENS